MAVLAFEIGPVLGRLEEVDASLAADCQIAWNAPFRLDHIPPRWRGSERDL
jgi:hypothetical protein